MSALTTNLPFGTGSAGAAKARAAQPAGPVHGTSGQVPSGQAPTRHGAEEFRRSSLETDAVADRLDAAALNGGAAALWADVSAPHPSACPACDVVGLVEAQSRGAISGGLVLSVPQAHCAACISTVERALEALPGVRHARLNLSLRRVMVDAEPQITPDDLTACLARVGYLAHELDSEAIESSAQERVGRDLLMRIGVSGFAMMNIMLLSYAIWAGADPVTRDMFHWISAAIALPVVAFAARPFFVSALGALRVSRVNMDVPIALAILLACVMSLYETIHGGRHAYFDAAVSLTFFLLGGRYLDHYTRAAARSAAQTLAGMEVQRALLLDGRQVPVAELRPGDLIRILPGARVPADGAVTEGSSETDRSLLTGESLPVAVAPGAALAAGEMNLTGPLVLRVTAAGKDSTLSRMAELVAVAETARNRYTSLADLAAKVYVPVVHLLAVAAWAGWLYASGDMRWSVNVAVATLIITCPCALGLAVPAVVTAASGRLFRRGMLVKSATALERLAEVDTVVFDKTGTLTEGQPELETAFDDLDAASVALALARGSSHPLAQALARAAEAAGIAPAELSDIREIPGHGVEGLWQGQIVRLGRAAWTGHAETEATATCLQLPDRVLAYEFRDQLREGALEAVAGLRRLGLNLVLLSGDTPAAVAKVAQLLGIEAFHAGLLPAEKAAHIAALKAEGRKVLMVGDGLNDTVALAEADVSISPASALEAARAVSDIVLLGKSLQPLPRTLRIARLARRRILENFAISALYNVVAIPIALAGFATPLAASIAMSSSSIIVSLNALRLR